MIFCALISAAFLLGGIPTGIWVGYLVKGVDVRRYGSGNLGATNVSRTVGKLPGLLVLAVDMAKGWAPVVYFPKLAALWGAGGSPEALTILVGVAAVAGHIWNPFLQFQGGKGVATSLGVLLGLDLAVGVAAVFVWILAAILTRYVSVASVSAALAAPFLIALLGLPISWVLGTIAVALSVIARHRSNFLRLLHGEEHRIGSKK